MVDAAGHTALVIAVGVQAGAGRQQVGKMEARKKG